MSSSRMPNTHFDAAEFYSLASWLHDTKPSSSSQALRRTIIGRAYYAALISARDFLGQSTIGDKGHKAVVDALAQKVSTQISAALNALRMKRADADYRPEKVISPRDVEISLRNALIVLREVKPDSVSNLPYSIDYLDSSKFLNPTSPKI